MAILYFSNNMFFLSFFIISKAYFIYTLEANVCLLKKRLDETTGTDRWSLPKYKRCYCTSVLTPKFIGVNNYFCGRNNEEAQLGSGDLWFTDDSTALINMTSWSKQALDLLLERDFCCELELCWNHWPAAPPMTVPF